MRIEQLEYFLDIAKTKSLNVSAERLFLTQPAISEAMRKLENELKYELLIRSKKGVELTAEGLVVKKWAEKIIEDINSMKIELGEIQATYNPDMKGDLCIGATNITNNIMLPSIIRGFYSKYPNVGINVFNVKHHEIPEFLYKGTIDIALFNFFCYQKDSGELFKSDFAKKITFKQFYEDPLLVLAGRNFSVNKDMTLQDVAKYPLIALQSYMMEEREIMKVLKSYGDLDYRLITDNLSIFIQALTDGRGIALCTKKAYSEIIKSHDVKPIKLEDNLKMDYYWSCRENKKLNMPEKAFIDYITNM